LIRIVNLPSDRPRQRLFDILENAERISNYIGSHDERAFIANQLLCDAVERCLERICEAVVKLGPGAETLLADQPVHKIRALGNILRHEYDGIYRPLLWKIATIDVPAIRTAAQKGLLSLD
jgi:uncharacterized protein with HEPN domain